MYVDLAREVRSKTHFKKLDALPELPMDSSQLTICLPLYQAMQFLLKTERFRCALCVPRSTTVLHLVVPTEADPRVQGREISQIVLVS